MEEIVVLGAGPGGYHLAEIAAKAGKKITIIEKSEFGGTCLNVGCIPSKAFLHVEKIIAEANHSHEIGIIGCSLSLDQKKVVDYKNKKVKFLTTATERKVKASGATILKGKGIILKPENGIYRIKVNDQIVLTKNLVIATGSHVFLPPIKGLQNAYQKGDVITSTEALDLVEIPKVIIVVGAGVIGLELGSYYAGAGAKVIIVELGEKIAGQTDREISTKLQEALTKVKNITFKLKHTVTEINNKEATLINQAGELENIKFDKLLICAGRKANIKGFGLENLKLFLDKEAIVVNNQLKTNVPNVYAIGDVNGKLMLAHTAYREAEIVLDAIENKKTTIDYHKIPAVIYGYPEIAEIGLTEEYARFQGINVGIKKISMLYSGRFVVEEDKFEGLTKIVIDKDTDEIIGMSIFGNYASEIIIAGSLIIGKRFNVNQIKEVVFAHPTVGEIIKDALFH